MSEDMLKDSWNIKGSVSEEIVKKIKAANGRYWAGDNISKYLEEGDKQKLIEELTTKFEAVLDSLCLLYTSPSPRDRQKSRMPSSA